MMREIALKYLKELGISNTQYAISKHTDKAHLHMHIVANMVNNEGKAISDSWIGLKGKKISQKLTQEYKLIPALEKNLKLTNLEALNDMEATKYKIYIAVAENLPNCRTMEELIARLLKLGIETQYKYKGQTQERQGVSFKQGNICFKGSHVDRKFSYAGLEKALEQQQKQALEQQQKQEQKPRQKDNSYRQKIAGYPTSEANNHGESGKDLSKELLKGLEKTIDILLKPEQTQGQMPYELSQQAERRKKKKQSHRL